MVMFCDSCGSPLRPGARFCPRCGAAVVEPPPPPAPPPSDLGGSQPVQPPPPPLPTPGIEAVAREPSQPPRSPAELPVFSAPSLQTEDAHPLNRRHPNERRNVLIAGLIVVLVAGGVGAYLALASIFQ